MYIVIMEYLDNTIYGKRLLTFNFALEVSEQIILQKIKKIIINFKGIFFFL